MNILLVDDDIDSRSSVGIFLRQLGHNVIECDNGKEALCIYTKKDIAMVLSDIKMPNMSGLELLRAISSIKEKTVATVFFTGYGDMDSAIQALRLGAYDYMLKPINVDELAVVVEQIAQKCSNSRRGKNKAQEFLHNNEFFPVELINAGFYSQSMQKAVQIAKRYHADRSLPVLIQGETGTGKEVLARMIHFGEEGSERPFIDINCAAINSGLFESELFGYEAGAFTGSSSKGRKGKFEMAHGGTLFLDEVGELSYELQGKLLRVIQEKEFYPVGSVKKIKADVRIICATNANLAQKVEEGSFRRDLYYRLNVGHLFLQPLRERTEDIIPLANNFLVYYSQWKNKHFRSISKKAQNILIKYNWPGNVRELKNLIEWIVFMYDDTCIKAEHLGNITKQGEKKYTTEQPALSIYNVKLPDDSISLEDHINAIILKALEKHDGNKTAAAMYLGISRRSLYCHLERIGKTK